MEQVIDLFPSIFNFLILIGVIAYFTKQPLLDFVQNRHQEMKKAVEEASAKLKDAEAKYQEYSAKLKSVDTEADAIRQHYKQDAQAKKEEIVQSSQKAAENLIEDSRQAADQVYKEIQSEVLARVAQKVVERAEKNLNQQLTSEHRHQILRHFSEQVEKVEQ